MAVKKCVLLIVLVLVTFSGQVFCNDKTTVAPAPRGNPSIMIEAHLIGVTLEGLEKSGVKPLSMDHKSVSMKNILWCLSQPDMAMVVSKMKVSARNGVFSEVLSNDAVYDSSTKEYRNAEKRFFAEPTVKSVDNISIAVQYTFEKVLGNVMSEFRWRGSINVKPGVPQIAAEMQGFDFIGEGDLEKTISFLVITATIQDQSKQKTEKKSDSETKKVTDIDRMQGTWKGIEVGSNRGEWTFVIKGNQAQVDGPGPEDYTGIMVTDETTTPKSAQFTITKFALKEYIGKIGNNIYKFEGDKLILAGNEPGKPKKPTAFKPGNGTRVFEFTKVNRK